MSRKRVALVTGGAGGIGAEVCRALAEAGHRVAVADLDAASAESVAQEVGGFAVVLDVTQPDSVSEAIGRAGGVEVCVNCAGWDRFIPFLDTDEAFSEKVLSINLHGAIRVTRAVLPQMIEGGFGRIINIASDAGRVGSSLEAVYSAAKGGVIAFTKTIAREFARHGITANSVCPGPNDTALLADIAEARDNGQRVIEALRNAAPMRRLGTPQDVAPAVAFLAGDSAGFITGQTLSVSGGLTMA
jgi:2-hydroxycyclohexanecarboxyl-CoA dehydrogenase